MQIQWRIQGVHSGAGGIVSGGGSVPDPKVQWRINYKPSIGYCILTLAPNQKLKVMLATTLNANKGGFLGN